VDRGVAIGRVGPGKWRGVSFAREKKGGRSIARWKEETGSERGERMETVARGSGDKDCRVGQNRVCSADGRIDQGGAGRGGSWEVRKRGGEGHGEGGGDWVQGEWTRAWVKDAEARGRGSGEGVG